MALGLFLSAWVALTAHLQGSGTAESPPSPKSLVLVTVDTLRREHLGCYGYPRATSPRIDALAKESVVYDRAFASMATTFPSHLSILTGLYPHQHGSTSNRGAVRSPYQPAAGRESVAQALAARGYQTAGFVSSIVLNPRTGIHSGFHTFDAPEILDGTRVASETMDRALKWLTDQPPGKPVFLWVHLWDTHEPNKPRPSSAALFPVDDTLRAWVARRQLDVAALDAKFKKAHEVGERFFLMAKRERSPGERKNPPKFVRPQDARRAELSAKPVRIDQAALLDLYARYDACVYQVDVEVGRLLDLLNQRGMLASSVLVLTADHGQSLGENLFFGHGRDTLINSAVPILIRFPAELGIQAGRSSALVSTIDILPTVLPRLGRIELGDFQKQLAGEDLLAGALERHHVFTSEATEFHGPGESRPYQFALRTERWQLVQPLAGQGVRLHDLTGAGESVDVASLHPEIVAELMGQLETELARGVLGKAAKEGELDPEAEALLRSLEGLGYAGDD
jgi:arylsulfatase